MGWENLHEDPAAYALCGNTLLVGIHLLTDFKKSFFSSLDEFLLLIVMYFNCVLVRFCV